MCHAITSVRTFAHTNARKYVLLHPMSHVTIRFLSTLKTIPRTLSQCYKLHFNIAITGFTDCDPQSEYIRNRGDDKKFYFFWKLFNFVSKFASIIL